MAVIWTHIYQTVNNSLILSDDQMNSDPQSRVLVEWESIQRGFGMHKYIE